MFLVIVISPCLNNLFSDIFIVDLYAKEVFVFSPKGDLYALARGSSVLDFAFKVHSQLGSHCLGAKVNGKQVPIKHKLIDGDTVDIITSNHQSPKREWLQFVRTSKAKSRIRSWLKRQQREESVSAGKKMIQQGLAKYGGLDAGRKEYQRKMSHLLTTFKLKDETHLSSALGYGQIKLDAVMMEIFGSAAVKTRAQNENKKEKADEHVLSSKVEIHHEVSNRQPSSTTTLNNGIIVGQERNVLLKFCKNCNPLMGEEVKGVVSKGKGVKVHRLGCRYLLDADNERIVDVHWDEGRDVRPRPVRLEILCEDIPGVLANMSRCITSEHVNIGNLTLRKLTSGQGLARLEVMVRRLDELEKVMTHLRMEDGIISVSRR